jgi:hypothetical protein
MKLSPLETRLRDKLMDLHILFLAEMVRSVFISKVKNHNLKLNEEPVFLLLCQMLYHEVYGKTPSKPYMFTLIKKYTKGYLTRFGIQAPEKLSPASRSSNKKAVLEPTPRTPTGMIRAWSEGRLQQVGKYSMEELSKQPAMKQLQTIINHIPEY